MPHTTRRPLILIPGLLNDAGLWHDQLAALQDIADCHVPDITNGDTIEALASTVLAEAPPHFAQPRFALAGFSLGGYVAQEIIRQAPARVAGLALLDTAITADTPERTALRRKLDRAASAPGHLQARFHGFGEHLLRTYLDPSHLHDEAIIGRIRAMTERLGPAVFRRQNALERKDGTHILRNLAIPTLILCGENDALTPLHTHQAMLELVPEATLAVIPRSGHMTPIENPAAVTQALRTWLLSIP